MKNDARYHIGLEFTGADSQQHVVRFCGEWVSPHSDLKDAEEAQQLHQNNRGVILDGFNLLAAIDSVIWVYNPTTKTHRICSGADITNTASREHAAESFGYAVLHQAECNGLLD